VSTAEVVVVNNGAPAGPEAPPPVSTAPARPDYVPEKFWDAEKGVVRVEEMAKSYGALETKLGGSKPADTPPSDPPPADIPPTPADDAAAAAALTAKGVDYAKLQEEFTSTGKLSDETFADLEKRGIPRQMAEDFISARAEAASAQRSYALEGIGEETFGQVVEWAKANLTPADIDTFNRSVEGAKSKEDLKAAVTNLHARYEQANGSSPSLLSINSRAPAADVYESFAQVSADMMKPEYAADPAFRAKVEAKIARSKVL
jgi:hypothetical protein